ncbi:ABC transporter ATP-binding protein [Sphingobacterium sp. lm-10]|uniref:ATP-binding cassette domain-containing protein n=1 Tax=Sphingobacterium sp. lm-10 TaxID=2944904 RepID=UPI002021148F|nr:ABC transporter ATP-binding protein [Sphingobacterium sp. lm-10]MCL7987210.1 ABC transporter ATP-binding protein [Sphingobacterium sp. lm-10]
MIDIKDISKEYNGQTVLHIPALHIYRGDCIGLVGNNGAGKTTLFSILLDLIPASTGMVQHQGLPASETDDWKAWTTAFLDESFLIGYLTPEEFLYFIAEVRQVDRHKVDLLLEKYQDFFQGEVLHRGTYIRDLSKGNQKKVGIISTLIGDPAVIIWDEPFANLDPSTQIRLKNMIKDLTASGEKTLVISSHDLSHTVDVSSRIIALDRGIIVKDVATSADTLPELEQFFMV